MSSLSVLSSFEEEFHRLDIRNSNRDLLKRSFGIHLVRLGLNVLVFFFFVKDLCRFRTVAVNGDALATQLPGKDRESRTSLLSCHAAG